MDPEGGTLRVKVILTNDVAKLGKSGELKEVADGYARNYLIPNKFAVPAAGGGHPRRAPPHAKPLGPYKVAVKVYAGMAPEATFLVERSASAPPLIQGSNLARPRRFTENP